MVNKAIRRGATTLKGARWLRAGMAALAFGMSGTAHATVIYQTGFENPPYTVGTLAGQDGWALVGPSGAVTVQTAIVASGLQAAQVNGALVTGQNGPFRSSPTALSLISLSADVYLSNSSVQRDWQFAALGAGLIGFAGGIDIDASGTIRAITSGFTPIGTFSRGIFHNVDIRLNYATQTYGVRLDGVSIASGIAFCGDNGPCAGATLASFNTGLFDTFGVGGNDLGIIDNYRVETFSLSSVPEPGSWALMLTGFGLAGAALRRKPRQTLGVQRRQNLSGALRITTVEGQSK